MAKAPAASAAASSGASAPAGRVKRRERKNISSGVAHVNASFNNTMITITDDQAIVLPCASVIVIMVLLNEAATCATPDAMFLRSRRRTRVASLPILDPFRGAAPSTGARQI